MATRRERRLLRTASAVMQPGERVELIAMAKLGSTKEMAKRNAASTVAGIAGSLVAGALTGGGAAGAMLFAQREVYLVLSDLQLMVFESNVSTGGPGRHLVSFPRQGLRARDLKAGIFTSLVLDVPGMAPLRLSFPPIPPKVRRSGIALAQALEQPPAGYGYGHQPGY